MALAIGANTAIFSVVNTVIVRPLPFAAPDWLVQVGEKNDAMHLPIQRRRGQTGRAARGLLARAAARQKEIAIRTALGAGRGRLMFHLLAESLMLSGAGVVLGVLLALWAVAGINRSLPPNLLPVPEVGVDGAGRSSAGAVRPRLRNGLAASELALATVLLIGAALLIQTLIQLQHPRVGFDQASADEEMRCAQPRFASGRRS